MLRLLLLLLLPPPPVRFHTSGTGLRCRFSSTGFHSLGFQLWPVPPTAVFHIK
jgi:hypothetical protein